MRVAPSADVVSGTNYYAAYTATATRGGNNLSRDGATTENALHLQFVCASDTAGRSAFIRTNNGAAYLAADAEL